MPDDLDKFDLIIHCGDCMLNRPEMQYRINTARKKGVVITNYGMFIAYVHGILERTLKPFTAAAMAYREEMALIYLYFDIRKRLFIFPSCQKIFLYLALFIRLSEECIFTSHVCPAFEGFRGLYRT